MFGDLSSRLIREKWNGVQELAQELVAMFQDGIQLRHQAPLSLTNSSSETPALTITHANAGTAVIKVQDEAGNELGGLYLENGDLTFKSMSRGANNSTYPAVRDKESKFPDPLDVQDKLTPDETGKTWPGVIVTAPGGTTYTVRIYRTSNLLAAESEVVTATQLGDSTLAVGDFVQVVQSGTGFFLIENVGSGSGSSETVYYKGATLIGHKDSYNPTTTIYTMTLYPDGVVAGTNTFSASVRNATGELLTNVDWWLVVNVGDETTPRWESAMYPKFM